MWRTIVLIAVMLAGSAHGVAAQTNVDIESTDIEVDGTISSISPDGAWLFGQGPDNDACLWSLPDLEATCDGFVPALDPTSIAWSPNGSSVAFSQDSVRLFVDSDISLMDIETGTVTSLTDDPDESNERLEFNSDAFSMVDTQPLWSADGASITFLRTPWNTDIEGTRLSRVDVASGEVEELFVLSPTLPFASYTPLFLDANGDILVSIDTIEPGAAGNGIWTVASDGSRIDRLTPEARGDEDGRYTIQAVSDDATTAIVQDIGAVIAAERAGEATPWSVLDLESGAVSPMLDSAAGKVYGNPVFIKDGDNLLFLVETEDVPLAFATGIGDPEILVEVPDAGERLPIGLSITGDGAALVTWNDDTATRFTGASEAIGEDVPAPCSCAPQKR